MSGYFLIDLIQSTPQWSAFSFHFFSIVNKAVTLSLKIFGILDNWG